MKTKVVIGTRGSKLALWQANFVKSELESLGIQVDLKVIKTKGDQIQHLSFDKIEGKGFFTKEIEEALLAKEIDLAVHSMKDLPTNSPEGLSIAGVSKRANPADSLVMNPKALTPGEIFRIKKGAVVGTSSARRKAQLKDFRPDIVLKDIRGNVPTRLKKLQEGQFDGIILAAAGLERLQLDLSAFEVFPFNPKEFVSAPAQGVLAYQTRSEDVATKQLVKAIHDKHTAEIIFVERKVLNLFDGGCQLPLGVYCEKDHMENYHVFAAIANSAEGPIRRAKVSYSTRDGLPEKVVEELQKGLFETGHLH